MRKDPLHFIDAGATNDEPARGVTNGDLRQWHDRIERLIDGLGDIHEITQVTQCVECWQKIQNIEATAAAALGRDLVEWEVEP